MVYDLEEPSSLEDIQSFWIPEAYNYVEKGIDVLLLGNKSDSQKRVSEQVNEILFLESQKSSLKTSV